MFKIGDRNSIKLIVEGTLWSDIKHNTKLIIINQKTAQSETYLVEQIGGGLVRETLLQTDYPDVPLGWSSTNNAEEEVLYDYREDVDVYIREDEKLKQYKNNLLKE